MPKTAIDPERARAVVHQLAASMVASAQQSARRGVPLSQSSLVTAAMTSIAGLFMDDGELLYAVFDNYLEGTRPDSDEARACIHQILDGEDADD